MRAYVTILYKTFNIWNTPIDYYKLRVTCDGKEQTFGFYSTLKQAVDARTAVVTAYELIGIECAMTVEEVE
jgi:hypothetical protein